MESTWTCTQCHHVEAQCWRATQHRALAQNIPDRGAFVKNKKKKRKRTASSLFSCIRHFYYWFLQLVELLWQVRKTAVHLLCAESEKQLKRALICDNEILKMDLRQQRFSDAEGESDKAAADTELIWNHMRWLIFLLSSVTPCFICLQTAGISL